MNANRALGIALFGIWMVGAGPAFARQSGLDAEPTRTILDGVYSAEQGDRGQAAYNAWCSRCHGGETGGDLRARDLTDPEFIDRWREYDVGFLYEMIRENMPPRTEQKPADEEYVDILTYLLQRNGYPTGEAELTHADLEDVLFVGPNGPQPVPSGSLAITVGCLAKVGEDRWGITDATEPRRTESSTISPAEQDGARTLRPGNLAFRVVNFDYVAADFSPEPLDGHRVLVKGYLIRQPNAERFNLTDMDSLAESCGP